MMPSWTVRRPQYGALGSSRRTGRPVARARRHRLGKDQRHEGAHPWFHRVVLVARRERRHAQCRGETRVDGEAVRAHGTLHPQGPVGVRATPQAHLAQGQSGADGARAGRRRAGDAGVDGADQPAVGGEEDAARVVGADPVGEDGHRYSPSFRADDRSARTIAVRPRRPSTSHFPRPVGRRPVFLLGHRARGARLPDQHAEGVSLDTRDLGRCLPHPPTDSKNAPRVRRAPRPRSGAEPGSPRSTRSPPAQRASGTGSSRRERGEVPDGQELLGQGAGGVAWWRAVNDRRAVPSRRRSPAPPR